MTEHKMQNFALTEAAKQFATHTIANMYFMTIHQVQPSANPYLIPATEHLRNRIILHVKVPVLSENMYFTCNMHIMFHN